MTAHPRPARGTIPMGSPSGSRWGPSAVARPRRGPYTADDRGGTERHAGHGVRSRDPARAPEPRGSAPWRGRLSDPRRGGTAAGAPSATCAATSRSPWSSAATPGSWRRSCAAARRSAAWFRPIWRTRWSAARPGRVWSPTRRRCRSAPGSLDLVALLLQPALGQRPAGRARADPLRPEARRPVPCRHAGRHDARGAARIAACGPSSSSTAAPRPASRRSSTSATPACCCNARASPCRWSMSTPITVTYDHPLRLMQELRAMGEANALVERGRAPLKRATLLRACEIYQELFGDGDDRVPATFQILMLSGWAPDPGQPQPIRRGSGRINLAEALGVPPEVLDGKRQALSRAAPLAAATLPRSSCSAWLDIAPFSTAPGGSPWASRRSIRRHGSRSTRASSTSSPSAGGCWRSAGGGAGGAARKSRPGQQRAARAAAGPPARALSGALPAPRRPDREPGDGRALRDRGLCRGAARAGGAAGPGGSLPDAAGRGGLSAGRRGALLPGALAACRQARPAARGDPRAGARASASAWPRRSTGSSCNIQVERPVWRVNWSLVDTPDAVPAAGAPRPSARDRRRARGRGAVAAGRAPDAPAAAALRATWCSAFTPTSSRWPRRSSHPKRRRRSPRASARCRSPWRATRASCRFAQPLLAWLDARARGSGPERGQVRPAPRP